MRTGRLRRRVTLRKPVVTRGTSGGTSKTFSDVVTVWGGVEPLSVKEILAAQAAFGEVTHRIVIRYYKGIQSDWQVRLEDVSPQVFYTLSGPPLNQNTKDADIHLMAKEGPISG